MLAVRLPEDMDARLTALAKSTGRTKSYYVRQALAEQMADLEDYYLAEQRLADVKAGRSKTYTLEEMERELDVAD